MLGKKVIIIGGAVLGGLAALHFAGTSHPGFDIVIGVMVGAFVASMVWEISSEETDDRESDDRASGQGKS
jgi:hypothetical protein